MEIDWVLVAFFGVLLFFHLAEALLTAVFHPREFCRDSFLVSIPYTLAMGCAVAEYLLEARLWPAMKSSAVPLVVGGVLIVAGEALRKMAILTSRRNFTQRIAEVKSAHHRLVQNGIYAVVRHPAYLGWLIWCVGTQVMLSNPVCAIAFAGIAWRFIDDRIRNEEHFLVLFFPAEYPRYRRRVPTWIPFVP